MIYFIADLHFDDGHIMEYENRPFETVDDMNNSLRNNWNSIAKSDDEVYDLGDIGDSAKGNIFEYIHRFSCEK